VGGTSLQQVFDDLLALLGRHVGVGQRVAELVVGLEGLGETEDLVVGTSGIFGAQDGEESLGISVDGVAHVFVPRKRWMGRTAGISRRGG
jgi:hypothetical protein